MAEKKRGRYNAWQRVVSDAYSSPLRAQHSRRFSVRLAPVDGILKAVIAPE